VSAGALVSGGICSLLTTIGIVNRLAFKTKTVSKIKLYENTILFSAIISTFIYLIEPRINLAGIQSDILMAFYGKHREKAKQFFYIALIFSILLGTISLQSRHKTVLFPIICIMAAYGSVYYNKKYTGTDTLIATVIIFVQILLALISLR
jgi:hypothetical protein